MLRLQVGNSRLSVDRLLKEWFRRQLYTGHLARLRKQGMHTEFWRASLSDSPLEGPTRKYYNGIEICLLRCVRISFIGIHLGSCSLTYLSIIVKVWN